MNHKTVPEKKPNDVFSSMPLAESRVYFRIRNNSRIRKARLVVSPEEGLVVESPKDIDVDHAFRMIEKRKNWVLDAIESIKSKQKKARAYKKHLNSVLVFGREKVIHVKFSQKRDFILEKEDRIYIGFTKSRARKLDVEVRLTDWLKEKANRFLPLRVRHINKNCGFKISQVFVKDQKTIWGSCSSDGNINLNWRLIMAPRQMSDYIIMHELSHTKYLDHSTKFWNVVKEICPHYEETEKWFQNFGFLLHINLYNWV